MLTALPRPFPQNKLAGHAQSCRDPCYSCRHMDVASDALRI